VQSFAVKNSGKFESGFTLLELMMVVFVIGIMASLTVMSIGGNTEREFRRDVARIQQVFILAQDEAPFAGEEIGFALDSKGESYSFLTFDDAKLAWEPLEKEGFSEHKMPQQYEVNLEISGDRVDLARVYKEAYKKSDKLDNWLTEEKPKKKSPVPLLIFFSDGHYTPFSLQISSSHVKEFVYVIEGDGLGGIHMRQAQAGKKRKSSRD
jgi:general secretion pathway protein H